MHSAKEIIERMKSALGATSDQDLADLIGVAKTTVSSWRQRNSIPYKVCVKLASGTWFGLEKGVDSRAKISLPWLITGEGDRMDSFEPSDHHDLEGGMVDQEALSLILEVFDQETNTTIIEPKTKAYIVASLYNDLGPALAALLSGQFSRTDAVDIVKRGLRTRTKSAVD